MFGPSTNLWAYNCETKLTLLCLYYILVYTAFNHPENQFPRQWDLLVVAGRGACVDKCDCACRI